MRSKFDVTKLDDSVLQQIQDIAQGLTEQEAGSIKSAAVLEYVNKAVNYRNTSQFGTHCYVIAIVNYLNNNGFEITKKETK